MREIAISNVEIDFILSLISDKKRLDGRSPDDLRHLNVAFGSSYGSCIVDLGNTRVLAQVSAEIQSPKDSRPNEGVMFVDADLSPMAHPTYEQGRQTDECIQLSRRLERCLKESQCVDMESLCISVGKKAWIIRVNITILNHDGNILDCASIASMSALANFRLPEVTMDGEEIIVHSSDERDLIPLSVYHIPVCCTFAFYHSGKCILLDPIEKEERVAEGKLVVGLNQHREICMLQISGHMMIQQDVVKACVRRALSKVVTITQLIRQALDNDKDVRTKGSTPGFPLGASCNVHDTLMAMDTSISLSKAEYDMASNAESGSDTEEELVKGYHVLKCVLFSPF